MSADKKEIYIASRAIGKSTAKMYMQRTRHETSTERDLRVAEEEAYMAKYEKRNAKKKTK